MVSAVGPWVCISFDTLKKQFAHHPDLSVDFYEDLDWLFLSSEVVKTNDLIASFFFGNQKLPTNFSRPL